MTRGPLCELVPIENAAMPDRTVIQWNKDDLDELGILKVDCLALGMLTAIRKCFDLVERALPAGGCTLATVPADDPAVYDMICRADTMGVFQIESRAQMSMLPRLQPRMFYDLVIEVAIVRPGPIQGNMVHPYLRRRDGEEPVTYPNEAIRGGAGKDARRAAVSGAGDAAGRGGGRLHARRGRPAAPRDGRLAAAGRDRPVPRQADRRHARASGLPEEFAEHVFRQIRGFGEYGFPESHAASFALLVYVSAWLKYYYPAAFTAALLNSQPMGFYAPAQIVPDARQHGVEVLPVDVNHSEWDCTLEECGNGKAPSLRLGLRLVKSLSPGAAACIMHARAERGFESVQDLALRTGLGRGELKDLAASGALAMLSGHRRLAYWDVAGIEAATPLTAPPSDVAQPELLPLTDGQKVVADYAPSA